VTNRVATRARSLREAFDELLVRELSPSTGHLTALVNCCVFAPSLLTFWFVNGVLDFSTAFLIGSLGGPGGIVVRLAAYLLLVPVFLSLRIAYYLAHPVHRRAVLAGSCPTATVLSLDWFSVGILATGLPFALQDLGPWIGMNAVFLVGIFLLPRFIASESAARAVKLTAIALGSLVFAYANYGGLLVGLVPALPPPAAVLGPVATIRLSDATTATLLAVTNSVATGPAVVAAFALLMNRLLTRPEVTSLPMVRHSLPRRDPARIVLASAALGTVFYLGVVWLLTGRASVLPL